MSRKLLLLFALLLAACRSDQPAPTAQPTQEATDESPILTEEASTAEPTETPDGGRGPLVIEDGKLYVAIIWHQHQPVYYKDPETGIYQKPWVRVHATKDYLDMATTVAQYPNVHVTFNYTPSLIRQLDDYNAGAQDLYWTHSEIPANELTEDQKRFILERFFDTNTRIIERFPRYQELADLRGGGDAAQISAALESFEEQDYRDLQVLFNLAWMDPDWLADEPLASLVAKERDYAEEDKEIIFEQTRNFIEQVIPYHAELQESGQIEVTMTPYAHPILPLLVDSSLAGVALPDAELPPRFSYPQDAVEQVNLGVRFYEEHFGQPPRGMWPAEGSVAQIVVSMVANAGIQWMATDEGVLANSLDEVEDFTRDESDTVQQADALYQPYQVSGRAGDVTILFRDRLISDKVGFEYSGMGGEEAAADFMQRLENIQDQLEAEGAEGPHLVTVLLDGENAWEHYENDGKEFLHALYRNLSESETVVTVTPSEYLAATTEAPRQIEELWPGSWIDHSFATWIGEEEENTAWSYLLETRAALEEAIRDGDLDADTQAQALDMMYLAEGSDWFWWYGADQNSGNDDAFDAQFRSYLEQVWRLMGEEPPGFVSVPIIPQSALLPDVEPQGTLTATADGIAAEDEWSAAALYQFGEEEQLTALNYGFDTTTMYLRFEAAQTFSESPDNVLDLYMKVPTGGASNAYSRNGGLLGFGANQLIRITFANQPTAVLFTADGADGWTEVGPISSAAVQGSTLEIAVPFDQFFPGAASGDRIMARAVYGPDDAEGDHLALVPQAGPMEFILPDLPLPNVFLNVTDPEDDDHGPGTYTYPGDQVFVAGVFDIANVQAGYNEQEVMFRIDLVGPVRNHWGSPNGMSGQTIDIYIDVDGPTNGDRLLLPGRNAALTEDHAWDYAIWAEGWTPGVYQPGEEGPVQVTTTLDISANAGQGQVNISVPRDLLPGEPQDWAITVVVLGQEGFPSAGVWRVRDVNPAAEQWRFGGAPDDRNHTRIIDVAWPEGAAPTQEEMLSDYEGSTADIGDLTPDDFPKVPMLEIE